MPLFKHIRTERDKIFVTIATSTIGFLIALLVNSAVQRHHDYKSYLVMLAAIRAEAESNKETLANSFLRYFESGIVLREFTVTAASDYLKSPIFLERISEDDVRAMTDYIRDLRHANAYRELSERLHLSQQKKDVPWLLGITGAWTENLEVCQKRIDRVLQIQSE